MRPCISEGYDSALGSDINQQAEGQNNFGQPRDSIRENPFWKTASGLTCFLVGNYVETLYSAQAAQLRGVNVCLKGHQQHIRQECDRL